MTYLRSAGIPGLRAYADCESCCCPATDAGYGPTPGDEPNPAPWFDPANPDSGSFLGLYGSLTLGLVDTDNGFGLSQRKRRLTFTGVVLSSCDGGRVFGDQWVRRVLDNSCTGCDDLSAAVFTWCGATPEIDEETGECVPVSFANPRPDPDVGLECCDGTLPPTLGTAPVPELPADSGQRVFPSLRYVPGSYQPLADGAEVWPSCYGCRVTFSFDVGTSNSFHPPVEVCVHNKDVFNVDEPCCGCRDLCFIGDPEEDCGRCGRDCFCDYQQPDTNECSNPVTYTDDQAAHCRFSRPLRHTRRTCITPPTPYPETVPVLEIFSGETPVDLLITMWEAMPGLPDPATCAGEDIWCRRATAVPEFGVHIPAGSWLRLDGRTGTATLDCNGRTSNAAPLVEGCNGGGLQLPTLCCGKRLWVAIDADCYNPPGESFQMRLSVAGADRL